MKAHCTNPVETSASTTTSPRVMVCVLLGLRGVAPADACKRDPLMMITTESVETCVSTSQNSARDPVHKGLVLVELSPAWVMETGNHILSVETSAWRIQTGSRTGTDHVDQIA